MSVCVNCKLVKVVSFQFVWLARSPICILAGRGVGKKAEACKPGWVRRSVPSTGNQTVFTALSSQDYFEQFSML